MARERVKKLLRNPSSVELTKQTSIKSFFGATKKSSLQSKVPDKEHRESLVNNGSTTTSKTSIDCPIGAGGSQGQVPEVKAPKPSKCPASVLEKWKEISRHKGASAAGDQHHG